MSTFEPSTEGILLSPELCRRISEIMKEKGSAFTQQAIATRIKMNRETLRMKLRGERKIYSFELKSIAEALHMTVERLMQEDSNHLNQELQSIFDALLDPDKMKDVAQKITWTEEANKAFTNGGYVELLRQRALEIAQHLNAIAVGASERSKSLNHLGRAYFHLNCFKKAHDAWVEAYHYAKILAEQRNGVTEPLFKITANLMISYSNRKEYSELTKILQECEPVFENDPNRRGVIFYSLAKIAEHNGEFEQAREYYYQSLDAYYLTEHPNSIAKALHNTAGFEYRMRNYETSKELFEKAIPIFKNYPLFQELSCLKEYSKTLVKLGEIAKAEDILLKSINLTIPNDILFLKAQMLIILSVAKDEPEHAESVLDLNVSSKIKNIAHRYLMNYYDKKDDSQSVLKYYRMAKASSSSDHCDILLEEEL